MVENGVHEKSSKFFGGKGISQGPFFILATYNYNKWVLIRVV